MPIRAVTRVGKKSDATKSDVTITRPGVRKKTRAYPASVAQTVVIATVETVTMMLFI